MFLSFCVFDDLFQFFKTIGFLGILGPPSYGIGATIRIDQEMLCLPYAGFFPDVAEILLFDAFDRFVCLGIVKEAGKVILS